MALVLALALVLDPSLALALVLALDPSLALAPQQLCCKARPRPKDAASAGPGPLTL